MRLVQRLAFASVALVLVYILGVGPTYLACQRELVSWHALQIAYNPLRDALCAVGANDLVEIYIDFWSDEYMGVQRLTYVCLPCEP